MKFGLTWLGISTLIVLIAAGLSAWTIFKSSKTYHPRPAMTSFHSLTATTIDGQIFEFSQLKGKRVLIVNTASRCGFTPQYKELEELFQTHRANDFVILGFPCNDFGRQEPGTGEDITEFCEKNYGVSFQLMDKVVINGDDRHPAYQWLCEAEYNGVTDHKVAWNFHKFLVDEEGRLVGSMRSGVSPLDQEIQTFAAGK